MMSGVRADRPQLAGAIAALDQGDVLAVTCIDHPARSSRDLLNIVAGSSGGVEGKIAPASVDQLGNEAAVWADFR